MNETSLTITEQLAVLASSYQEQRTGYPPRSVTVVFSDDTLVFTLEGALSPAEQALANTTEGASQVQEYHRQLFANSIDEMRNEIERITGRKIREAAAEVETASGTVVHAFSTGAMVQIFLMNNEATKLSTEDQRAIISAENEGMQIKLPNQVDMLSSEPTNR